MKNTDEVKKVRNFVSLLIIRWRFELQLIGAYESDKRLAALVGVSPVAFSRLLLATSTASLPVYHALCVAIYDTLSGDLAHEIITQCKNRVYGNSSI